ncbi:MBOAT family O-acyltransferase [Deinococcus maricopensis]|uniref:Membrane bound O-acyl transferase MBOAT family protein n=1 Tax=Deinococcus maricopensis (strain DSM 21211 / LMG 22137 / NRRL B-23946 / LB-34) TaxID=709986 RepID=E8U6R8_DEIML|nr:MBOAT family protein [Deinococcus maricopensis]ADV66757.1 membrane bound O-acyl transferase MBOAT family protein [Deinococcus maricopensis DSM 21211]
MVFNSDVFLFAFLPVVFVLFWTLRTRQARYVLLTLSGYVFYGYWDWRFCGLMLFSSLVSFAAGLLIDRARTPREKRAWMIGTVLVDLTLLGFFKYYNFFADTLHSVAPGIAPPLLNIILPIGISFYTFHTISYVVDVAAGRVRATRNIFEYLTYVSLFSQLVAGPIVRFRQIEEDLERIDKRPQADQMALGVGFFAVGLIKKVVVADSIARLVDPMLADFGNLSMAGAWLAALGYTFQLYYDFSGYSDMAVGLGYLFGIRIPQNFNAPYQALGIGDFWRRWHISLSSWLRDYLYIALGGNRRGPTRTNVNLALVMLIGGLWHGANWTFVVWGTYHGLLLVLDRAWQPWLQRWPPLLYRWGTFLVVVIGWVFFRAESLPMAFAWLGKMVGVGAGALDAPTTLVALCALSFVAVNTLPETWHFRFPRGVRSAPLYALGLLLAYVFMNGASSTFLYYQF